MLLSQRSSGGMAEGDAQTDSECSTAQWHSAAQDSNTTLEPDTSGHQSAVANTVPALPLAALHPLLHHHTAWYQMMMAANVLSLPEMATALFTRPSTEVETDEDAGNCEERINDEDKQLQGDKSIQSAESHHEDKPAKANSFPQSNNVSAQYSNPFETDHVAGIPASHTSKRAIDLTVKNKKLNSNAKQQDNASNDSEPRIEAAYRPLVLRPMPTRVNPTYGMLQYVGGYHQYGSAVTNKSKDVPNLYHPYYIAQTLPEGGLQLHRKESSSHGNTAVGDRARTGRATHRLRNTNTSSSLRYAGATQVKMLLKECTFRQMTPPAGGGGVSLLDIATCDGPVFFERVLNKAYAGNAGEDVDSDAEINVDDYEDHATCGDENEKTASQDSQKITDSDDGDERRRTAKRRAINTMSAYHCIYCNHTFKSHYCYQKHMRRHINPITVEVTPHHKQRDSEQVTVAFKQNSDAEATQPNTTESSFLKGTTDTKTNVALANPCTDLNYTRFSEGESPQESMQSKQAFTASESSDSKKLPSKATDGVAAPRESSSNNSSNRSLKQTLDLNVQYFPCKTCGCKFPSYYFVHKHRRLCHSNDEDTSRDNTSERSIAYEKDNEKLVNQVTDAEHINPSSESTDHMSGTMEPTTMQWNKSAIKQSQQFEASEKQDSELQMIKMASA